MKMLTRALRSIWSPWRNKKGATATNPKMMPRQHSGPDSSWRYRCKRKSDESVTCDRRWGDPGYRVPTRWWHGNEEKHARNNFRHGANAGISYNVRGRIFFLAPWPLYVRVHAMCAPLLRHVRASTMTRAHHYIHQYICTYTFATRMTMLRTLRPGGSRLSGTILRVKM